MERVELACHTGHSINMGVGSPSKWIDAIYNCLNNDNTEQA